MRTKEPEICHDTRDINTHLTHFVLAEYNCFWNHDPHTDNSLLN